MSPETSVVLFKDMLQTGGNLAMILIFVVLLFHALQPIFKSKDKEPKNGDIKRDYTWDVQRDNERTLNEIKTMISNQNESLNRIASALEKTASQNSSILLSMEQLPDKIAERIQHYRGNGHSR